MDETTSDRAHGAIIGSACADALGAPFEFRPAGEYSNRFPTATSEGATEMIGGGSFNWKPGEFTDDTQMMLCLAESLIEKRTFDPEHVWNAWQHWSKTAQDVGGTTRGGLSGTDWQSAASLHHKFNGFSAGNGGLMRATAIPLAYINSPLIQVLNIAFKQARLTHYDPAAGWGAAIHAAIIRQIIVGKSLLQARHDVFEICDPEVVDQFSLLICDSWTPQSDSGQYRNNGSVWICLAQAFWAVKTSKSFEECIVKAINLGGDTDTVACVAGGIAGALWGYHSIPRRWSSIVNGSIELSTGRKTYHLQDLQNVANKLMTLN